MKAWQRRAARLWTHLLCLFLVTALCPLAGAEGGNEYDYEYSVGGGKAVITGYKGSEAHLVIPSTLGGFPVTEIGGNAFRENEDIASVTIPQGVTGIGDGAFYGSGLAQVRLPESLERLGDMAFAYCAELGDIIIPAKVQRIGAGVFIGCHALAGIGVSAENAAFLSLEGVLYSGDGEALLAYPLGREAESYHIPAGVKIIMDSAFWQSGLSQITLPEGVTTIGAMAFDSCRSLKELHMPASVTHIAYHFRFASDCPALEAIHVAPGNGVYASLDGVLYDKPMTRLLAYPQGKGEDCFSIPPGVQIIASQAFEGCTALRRVEWPEGLETIDVQAFRFSGLEEAALPGSVREIGASAFGYCENLTEVTLPEGLREIGARAFSSCNGLTSIAIPPGVTGIGEEAFQNCPNLVLSGEAESLAHTYAQDNGIPFQVR